MLAGSMLVLLLYADAAISARAARAALVHECVDGEPATEMGDPAGGAASARDRAAAPGPGLRRLFIDAIGEALLVPHRAGRGKVLVDGAVRDSGSKGPIVAASIACASRTPWRLLGREGATKDDVGNAPGPRSSIRHLGIEAEASSSRVPEVAVTRSGPT